MSKFCPNCGRELPDEAVFCDECGYKMQQAPAQGFQPQSYQQGYTQNAGQPQSYQQGYAQGNQTQNYQQTGTTKSKAPLILGIVAAALILFVGGYFLSGLLKGKGKPEGNGEGGYITKKIVENPQGNTEGNTTASVEKSDAFKNENLEAEKPEAEETGEREKTTSESSGISGEDTLEAPVMDDFDWLYLEMWDDAEYISEFNEITGKWKGCIHYYQDEDEMELVYAEVKGTAEQVEMVIDPYEMYYNGEPPVDESDMDDYSYSGDFDSGWLKLDRGPGVLECSVIYYHADKEYMGGRITFPDGTAAVVGFVRPRK